MKALYLDDSIWDSTNRSLNYAQTQALEKFLIQKYKPATVIYLRGADQLDWMHTEDSPAGLLVTRVVNRGRWTCLPEHIKLEVLNGRAPSPQSLVEWALTNIGGVEAPKARALVKAGRFVGTPKPGKFQEPIKKTYEYFNRPQAQVTQPRTNVIRRPAEEKHYFRADDVDEHSLALLEYIQGGTIYLAFDIETTGLDPEKDELVGVSLSTDDNSAVWIPTPDGVMPPNVARILASPLIPKVTHGGKFDYKFLKAKGYMVSNIAHDTLTMAYVLQTEGPRKLKSLGESELGEDVVTFDEVVAAGKTFKDVDPEQQKMYACQDADLTLRLFRYLGGKLQQEGRLYDVYKDIEMPLLPILGDMELLGAQVHLPTARALLEKTEREIEAIEGAMWDIAGEEFNPISPKDLRYVLYEKLGLPPLKETKAGFAIDKFTLERLRPEHTIISLIMEWRVRDKLRGTYLLPLIDSYEEDAGYERIHGNFNQTVTATGRLSSSGPNLQNQPPAMRHVYRVPEGRLLIAADYSQQELRLMAHMSQDPVMLEAFMKGEDIHDQTAKLLGVPRRLAKNVNFGIPYGAGPDAIARQGKCSYAEARNMLDTHRRKYPQLWQWIDARKQEAHRTGFAETITGRRRQLPKIFSNLPEEVAAAEREAVNMAVQGSAADVTKLAMINISKKLDPRVCRLIMQVHDELVFEVYEPVQADDLIKLISDEMTAVGVQVGCSVPLLVDAHSGASWAELKG